jgi:hypothetical protein
MRLKASQTARGDLILDALIAWPEARMGIRCLGSIA